MKPKEWEEKYQSQTSGSIPDAAELLQTHVHFIAGGRALDIAMGTGQNAVFLARHGCDVTGVERSSTAVSRAQRHAKNCGVSINAVETDIMAYDLPQNCFDIIINFYFLERSLIPKIKNSLKKNGILFFETYTMEQQKFGRPNNPDYLLKPNEILTSFLDFFIILYHERIERSKAIASLVAQKL